MNMASKFFWALALILFGIAGRLLPHMPNATPITAIILAAGRHLGRTWSLVIPLIAMLASDAVIGFYNWRIMIGVYGSFALIGFISWFGRKNKGATPIVVMILVAPLIFFLITNFSVWLFSPWYEKSIAGLLYCYTLGIPFLRNMLIGDFIYTSLLVGGPAIARVAFGARHLPFFSGVSTKSASP